MSSAFSTGRRRWLKLLALSGFLAAITMFVPAIPAFLATMLLVLLAIPMLLAVYVFLYGIVFELIRLPLQLLTVRHPNLLAAIITVGFGFAAPSMINRVSKQAALDTENALSLVATQLPVRPKSIALPAERNASTVHWSPHLTECDEDCLKLLYFKGVDRVVTGMRTRTVTAFRLQRKDKCRPPEDDGPPVSNAWNYEETFLKLQQGLCLIEEPANIKNGELILLHPDVVSYEPLSTLDLTKPHIRTWTSTVYVWAGGSPRPVAREVRVSYWKLSAPLIVLPDFPFGQGSSIPRGPSIQGNWESLPGRAGPFSRDEQLKRLGFDLDAIQFTRRQTTAQTGDD